MLYEKKENGISISYCEAFQGICIVPEMIEEMPVVEIAPYTFSPSKNQENEWEEIREIYLPKTIEKIGAYAFYNLTTLKKLSFYDGIKDLGPGIFTMCHQIEELEVYKVEKTDGILREILLEIEEQVLVTFHMKEKETVQVLFPEFFEEGIENTPARICSEVLHGSGWYFRNSFQKKTFNFDIYDSRFPLAIIHEQVQNDILKIALLRLEMPYELSIKAKKQYDSYIEEHFIEACTFLVNEKKQRYFQMFFKTYIEKRKDKTSDIEHLIENLSEKQEVEAVSFLMNEKRSYQSNKRDKFEL